MTNPDDRPDLPQDPLATMSIERVRRPDGRSLIYYEWPRAEAEDDAHRPGSSTPEQSNV